MAEVTLYGGTNGGLVLTLAGSDSQRLPIILPEMQLPAQVPGIPRWEFGQSPPSEVYDVVRLVDPWPEAQYRSAQRTPVWVGYLATELELRFFGPEERMIGNMELETMRLHQADLEKGLQKRISARRGIQVSPTYMSYHDPLIGITDMGVYRMFAYALFPRARRARAVTSRPTPD